MSEADPSPLTIPLTLHPNVKSWTSNHVETFLKANKVEYQLVDEYLSAIRREEVNGRVSQHHGAKGCLLSVGLGPPIYIDFPHYPFLPSICNVLSYGHSPYLQP